MELRHLRALVAVADAGGFTAAAGRLDLVQSAVSGLIRSLERELGTPLFVRRPRGVELTDAGRAMLPAARAAIASADQGREAALAVRHGVAGTVRVAALQSIAMRRLGLPALLADFRRSHPAVEVQFARIGTADAVAEAVEAGTIDLGFAGHRPDRTLAGVRVRPLFDEALVVACPAGHPLAAEPATTLAGLAPYEFADGPPGWGLRELTDRAFAAAGVTRRVAFEVSEVDTVLDVVRHGLAVTLIPREWVEQAGDLVLVPIAEAPPVLRTSVLVPRGRALAMPAAVLLERILARRPAPDRP